MNRLLHSLACLFLLLFACGGARADQLPLYAPNQNVTSMTTQWTTQAEATSTLDIVDEQIHPERKLFSIAKSAGESYLASLGSDIALYISSVEFSFLQSLPTHANWVYSKWNVQLHDDVHQLSNTSTSRLDELASGLIIDTSIQQQDVSQVFPTLPASLSSPSSSTSSSATPMSIAGSVSAEALALPGNPPLEGDHDPFAAPDSQFLELAPMSSNATAAAQEPSMYTVHVSTHNAFSKLFSPHRILTISNINAIMRMMSFWSVEQGILDSFARAAHLPWLSMPSINADWSSCCSMPSIAGFPYFTTALPQRLARTYMRSIHATYPHKQNAASPSQDLLDDPASSSDSTFSSDSVGSGANSSGCSSVGTNSSSSSTVAGAVITGAATDASTFKSNAPLIHTPALPDSLAMANVAMMMGFGTLIFGLL